MYEEIVVEKKEKVGELSVWWRMFVTMANQYFTRIKSNENGLSF